MTSTSYGSTLAAGKSLTLKGDDPGGTGTNRSGEDVVVLRVTRQPVDQRLVAGHHCLRERRRHLAEQTADGAAGDADRTGPFPNGSRAASQAIIAIGGALRRTSAHVVEPPR